MVTAAALLGTGTNFGAEMRRTSDIAVASGNDLYDNTVKAIRALGGIDKYIPKNGTVGLLINAPAWWRNRGSFTHPDVTLAVINECLSAGVKELRYILDPSGSYWDRTSLSDKYRKEIGQVKPAAWKTVNKKIPGAKALKSVDMNGDIFKCDVFINLPIIKHHTGTLLTCNLKNLMGANTTPSNRFFHTGSGSKTSYGDVAFLDQCIAELNSLIKPALCVVDAGEVLTTNGPAGPGQLKKINKVVAGVNPVSVDAYCATLLGLKPEQVGMIKKASELKLGNAKLSQLNILKI
mgnify:CR=1 FL=1